MTAWRSSSLALAGRHCPRALDHLEAGVPYDRSIFHVGTAAHAVLEEIGKASTLAGVYISAEECEAVAAETCERLISAGRSFDGRPEPPMPSADVWKGRDLALRYCREVRQPSPWSRYEIELAVDREWRPLEDPHDPRAYFRAQLDAVGRWEPNFLDELDDGRSPAVEILDFKSAWSADASELETTQRKGQALVAWAHLGSPELTLRIVVTNIRLGKSWDREIDPNDEDGARTMARWRDDVEREIAAVDRRDGDGRRAANPGAACIGCPYLRMCPDAARSIAVEVLEDDPAEIAARWCLHKAEGDRLRTILEPLADDCAVPIAGGGTLGWVERAETILDDGAEDRLAAEWARRVTRGVPKEKHAEHLANSLPSLLLSLGMTATNATKLIETIIPRDAENCTERRAALRGSLTKQRHGRVWQVTKHGGKKPKKGEMK